MIAELAQLKRGENVDENLRRLVAQFKDTVRIAAFSCPDIQEACDICADSARWIYDAALKYEPARSPDFRKHVFMTVRYHVLHHIQRQHVRKFKGRKLVKKTLREFLPIEDYELLAETKPEDFDQEAAMRAIDRLGGTETELVRRVLEFETQRDAAAAMRQSDSSLSQSLTKLRPTLRRFYREERDETRLFRRRLMHSLKIENPFKIESNVPLPEPRKRAPRFPISELEVGDSFFAPVATYALHKAVEYHRRDNSAVGTFTVRKIVENGVQGARIWRTA